MNEEIKPLPCPWCRAENISVEWEHCERLESTDTNRRWFAECGKCACQGPFCQTEPEAIPAWNHRATDARLAQAEKALAELRAIAERLLLEINEAEGCFLIGKISRGKQLLASAKARLESAYTQQENRNP